MNEKPKRGLSRLRAVWREDIPRPTKIILIAALVAAALHLLACLHPSIADFFDLILGRPARAILAALSSIFPFSIAEMCLYALIPLVILFIVLAIRVVKDGRRFRRLVAGVLTVPVFVYILFALTLGFAYRASSLEDKLDLSRDPVSVQELYDTAVLLRDAAAERYELLAVSEGGSTVMPYSFSELSKCLLDAYASLSDEYDFLPRLYSRLKPVAWSEGMAYTHIAGVYTYMTGESNVNLVFPDYALVFTSAHELAHQRGIARENEANFVAFLVCTQSEDVYLQYAGYMSLFEYFINALATADRDRLDTLLEECPDGLLREMIAYNEIYDQYRDSVVGEISGAVNDAYLQSQGMPGLRSYGMVVDLTVAYYRNA